MSTYAQQKDVENFIEGWVTDDPFALERLIRRCERQLDRVVQRTRTENPPTQVISIIGATGGTYTLSWIDYLGTTNTTAPLPFNATAAQIQAALAGFSTIGSASGLPNVTVLGTNPFTLLWGIDWVRAHFVGLSLPAVDYQVPLITVDYSQLTPGGGSSTARVDEAAGRKINPLIDLDRNQRIGLAGATCAQVEYRNAMGEAFFTRPQYDSVAGPDFKTQGRLPIVSPKAKRELADIGLLQWQGRASSGWGRRGVAKGWPTY